MSAAPSFHESAATAEAAQAGLLYERYAGRLLAFCRARLSSREEAEDAVQQTFLNAHRSLRSGTVPRAEAAWMFAIAANVCRERHRSARRRSRVEVVSDDRLVGELAAPEHSHDELVGVADALAELTPNQRRAILMREWQGLSYREIAAELSLSEGAVETLIFRARRSLARNLDRSRRRVWGISNVGSALPWGKAAVGTTAAQVAAAALVVDAGVSAATPIVLLHGSKPPSTMPVRLVAAAVPAKSSAVPRRVERRP
jgi:RNA polymerase sigma-70 factor (ECF subfamily)